MLKALIDIVIVAVIGFVCWIGGSLYPAPPELLERVHAHAVAEHLSQDLERVDWEGLRGSLGQQRFDALAQRATSIATAAGQAIALDHANDADTSAAEGRLPTPVSATAPASPGSALAAAASRGSFQQALALCPRMTITNSPPADATGRVAHFTPVVSVNGVPIAVNPTRDACLSSGFGDRSGHLHKGLDFHNDAGGQIMAGGDGVIIEMKYRDDYGNMILIDHGHGVYTRYCHLSAFARSLAVGTHVKAGDQLGLMGNTAAYPLPIHLHYELLLGDYNNPKQSFGLTPHSPFEYHAA